MSRLTGERGTARPGGRAQNASKVGLQGAAGRAGEWPGKNDVDIGFKIIGFPGALREPGEVLIRARTPRPHRVSLAFVTVAGSRLEIAPTSIDASEWRIGIQPGPVLELPTDSGRQMSGPPIMFTEFHFLLDACPAAGRVQHRAPMNVSVERDGRRLWPIDLKTGAPLADREVEVHAELLDLYLRS